MKGEILMNSSDGQIPAAMKTSNRPIFRPEAVQRYTEAREQSVLPKFVSPRIIVALWTIVVLLILSGVTVWFTSMPVYASGLAIVVDTGNKSVNIEEGTAILVLLPPEAQPALDEGKTILIQVNASSKPLKREISTFEKDASKVNSILEEFALDNHPAVAKAQPAAVAIVRLEDMPENVPATEYIGTIFRADMQVGSRRVASLLPLMDRIL
jgi:hypothetical protein